LLFNSFIFIFGFMPVVLLAYYLLGHFLPKRWALIWLGVASLIFYGWGDSEHLPLLLGSIIFNFVVGTLISRRAGLGLSSGRLLAFGVGVDVLLLAWFKYADFVLANVALATGIPIPLPDISLPVGISFFTFTQIAYLTDCWRGETRSYRPHEYFLFVTYFPHLIAGPILLHKDVIPQFWKDRPFRFELTRLLVGLAIFGIGLFKKVVLADGVAPYADTLFGGVANGSSPDAVSAWLGALAYTAQLYFDFSGYSDMAVGLSHMIGFRLPVNFWSPYKAGSVIEFWRRWHISLSRFLADHIYKPLGGNRAGARRRYVNLMITMLIGGLWHGAGWTFVAWGALHGFYLVVNHFWRGLVTGSPLERILRMRWAVILSTLFTFVLIVIGWVIFRASSLDVAGTILQAMAGLGGSDKLFTTVGQTWLHLLVLLAILFAAPNTFQIMRRYAPYRFEGRTGTMGGIGGGGRSAGTLRFGWRLTPGWAVATAFILLFAVLSMATSAPSPFLYFQF
jgi:D-alanyl-lipoteichoic acid acyltransferase DltB (MBOAT superfamily)